MIYITGDMHGEININKFNSTNFPEGKNLTKNDYVLILGDFGLLWRNKQDKNELYWLNWLSNKPWTTLFIAGNHENYYRLNELETIPKFNSQVGKVTDSIFYLKRGNIYTIEDKTFFCMGGAKSIDKIHRIEGISWWKEEEPNYQEINFAITHLKQNGNKVDYILSHTCSNKMINIFSKFLNFNYDQKRENLCDFFDWIEENISFFNWYFGHFHDNIIIDDKHNMLYDKIKKITERKPFYRE